MNVDPVNLVNVFERPGRLYENAGNAKQAAHHFGRVVELRRNADPELQLRRKAAERSLARLQRAAG